jgi:hypothetical protein
LFTLFLLHFAGVEKICNIILSSAGTFNMTNYLLIRAGCAASTEFQIVWCCHCLAQEPKAMSGCCLCRVVLLRQRLLQAAGRREQQARRVFWKVSILFNHLHTVSILSFA